MPIEIGQIAALYRYPVKSMRGEALDTATMGWHGLDGDRRLAFRRATGRRPDHRPSPSVVEFQQAAEPQIVVERHRDLRDGLDRFERLVLPSFFRAECAARQ